MKIKNLITIAIAAILTACTGAPKDANPVSELPPMYPDYADVTVPCNIAPLNFLLRGDFQQAYATATYGDNTITADCDGASVTFAVNDWHDLLKKASGKSVKISVWAKKDGKWLEYTPFDIEVSADEIDPYLTYRLIEPDYEVFSRLQIKERCIEDFSERTLSDYNTAGNRCMNCHTYGSNRPDLSLMYLRGEGGGMILNRNGKLRKLAMKTPDMVSGSVYAQFSPSGRYIVFSSNVIIPAFHSNPSKRLEVFDTKSDIYVADLETNRIIRSPLLADSVRLETFPTFSPDGKSIYFCAADSLRDVRQLTNLTYSLCRIDFDEAKGMIGEKVDTVIKGLPGSKTSVCHPRISPDGRYLLYTVADYGTFPIWHPESDQRMLDLKTGKVNTMEIVNSEKSDTYHSWSSNGRWFVFASKRDDGMYGKPYFCHVSADGEVSKPFVLPQQDPKLYDNLLKSFNVPELGKSKVEFNHSDVTEVMALEGEVFR